MKLKDRKSYSVEIPTVCFLRCITNNHKLYCLKNFKVFFGSGVQAQLSWVHCKAAIKLLARAEFSSGDLSWGGPTSKLPQVVRRIYFLATVGFMAACFFKANKKETERERNGETRTTSKRPVLNMDLLRRRKITSCKIYHNHKSDITCAG